MMTHEEAKPIVAEMMRDYLQAPEGWDFYFTADDLAQAIKALPIEEYTEKRQALAAFRMVAES